MRTASSKENHTLFLLTVGLLAWLVPGAGHLLLKERKRALIIFTTIVFTFCVGIYIGSIGVINPVGAKPWYVAQIMNSPMVAVLGHLATDWLLFSIELKFQNDLDNRFISESLQQEFKKNGISLSQDANISVDQRSTGWLIISNKQIYAIRREEDKLNIYSLYPVFGRPSEIGQIYTSIAGLLNLLCIVNAVYLAHLQKTETAGD